MGIIAEEMDNPRVVIFSAMIAIDTKKNYIFDISNIIKKKKSVRLSFIFISCVVLNRTVILEPKEELT